MTKKVSNLFILLFFTYYFSFAQLENQFTEDFNNNNRQWSVSDNKDIKTKVENGFYVMQHKRKSLSYNFWRNFAIDADNDFYVEASLKQVAGIDNWGYGIVWGAAGWDNSYNFTISSNGMFTVTGHDKEEYFEWQAWKESKKIKPLGQINILAIKKTGDLLYFYINNSLVYTHKFKRLYGNKIGFIVGRSMTVKADFLKVKYQRVKINLVKNINPKYKKKNLGTKINSKYSEIAPIISPDGNTLYVGRQHDPQNYGEKKEYDIWYATRNKDDSWGKMKHMGKPINNAGDNLVIAVSPDGNTLWLEGLYSQNGGYVSDQGISVSNRTATGWSVPKKVVIEKFYNKNEYESYCPTIDRKVLIMSLERDDTYGQKDLYVSFRLPNGNYSQPFNMGTDINTFFNEGTPFIAPDNKTLYFYSYGHPGYGSADIFVTKRLDNSWRKWSKPKNLGPTINSSDWDTYYSIAAKGDFAYLVSTKGSFGNEDVQEIKMSEDARPDPVVLIYGRVYNKKTKKPIGVDIVYENIKTGAKVGTARSNPRTGTYKIILPFGKEYGFRAEANDYVAINEQVDLRKISKYKELKQNLYLIPIETGQVINLQSVQFKRSKTEFTETSYTELNRLVKLMKKYPKMEIELAGHTDSRGKPNLLMALSQKRVAAVKNYLVKHGVSSRRITGIGYGGTKPLATGTDDQEIKNRRVEFKIVKI
ncbi:MAG: hypothetical protein B6I20_05080 [Bacteroidetes bacterium 4572_117]|nr:MAG: hypothetical protein B6I20_05080 [Bacteroidetes bacterium 4572_117]